MLPEIKASGGGATVIEMLVAPEHALLVSAAEYEVVAVGLTTMEEVVAPVLQEYVFPPEAEMVTVLPAQMVVLLALRLMEPALKVYSQRSL